MLDKKFILENIEHTKQKLHLKKHNFDDKIFVDLENERKFIQVKLEELQNKRNLLAREKNLNTETIVTGKQIKSDTEQYQKNLDIIQYKIRDIMLNMPNLPADDVPVGNSEEHNVELKKWGKIRDINNIKNHTELGGLNFEKAVDIATTRFAIMQGKTAKLHRALLNFMLDTHIKNGYVEYNLPTMVNEKAMTGTGQFPKFKDDTFKLEGHDLYLIPTGEVPLTNLFANEKITQNLKLVAHTNCYRAEAGSAGKDTKGLIRQHQFEKVELVKIVDPNTALEEFELLLNDAERILQLLELPYRIVNLCTGDLGFGAKKTYDIEVWLPGQNKYREISSCTWFADFQARRINCKFEKNFAHTINGSGLAVGRTLVAVMENYQNGNDFDIPDVIKKYYF